MRGVGETAGPARSRTRTLANAGQNPFDTYYVKPDAGTGMSANAPILIPSTAESRMVGCCCEEDYGDVVWFELPAGGVRKCDCGYFFKLVKHDPLDPNVRPTLGMGFGSGLSRYF